MSSELLLKSVIPDIWPIGVAAREFLNRSRNFFRPPADLKLKLTSTDYANNDSNDDRQPNTILNSSLRFSNIVNFSSNSPDG
jgi:hypothetical protein